MRLIRKGDITADLPAGGGRQLGRSGREKQGQGAELAEGAMDTEGGSRGVWVMESEEAELVKGTEKKVGSEGARVRILREKKIIDNKDTMFVQGFFQRTLSTKGKDLC